MCGIVGYTGREAAAPIVLNGLSKLEFHSSLVCSVVVSSAYSLGLVFKTYI